MPVRYIGLGEGMEDLQLFNKEQFVDSLFKARLNPTLHSIRGEKTNTQSVGIQLNEEESDRYYNDGVLKKSCRFRAPYEAIRSKRL